MLSETCIRCGENLPTTYFYKGDTLDDGLYRFCGNCRNFVHNKD